MSGSRSKKSGDPFEGLSRKERMEKAKQMAEERYKAKKDTRTLKEIAPEVKAKKKKKKKKAVKKSNAESLVEQERKRKKGYFK